MIAENNSDDNRPQCLSDLGLFGLPELSDRDFACVLLPDLDYDAQLIAVHNLLRRHKDSDQALTDEIRRIEEHARKTKGLRNEHLANEWLDRLHASVYQDAAHSMAAVGMLAPLMESIFYQAFQATRYHLSATVDPQRDHQRWQQPAEDQWDCHFVWKSGRRSTNLVEGILQLADAAELSPYLPNDLKFTLQALFEYRNKMFHYGFEWPIGERQRFATRIDTSGWPIDWFAKATMGGDPWIFYLTDTFTSHCMDAIGSIIEGIGAFAREKLGGERK
jgi:hypothetical protein